MSEDLGEPEVPDPKYFDCVEWVKLRDAAIKVIDADARTKAAVCLRRGDLVDYSVLERVAKDKMRAVDAALAMIASIAAATKNVDC